MPGQCNTCLWNAPTYRLHVVQEAREQNEHNPDLLYQQFVASITIVLAPTSPGVLCTLRI